MLKEDHFMLWFNEEKKRSVEANLTFALRHFEEKYNLKPTKLLIPESQIELYQNLDLGIELLPKKFIKERYLAIR